MSMGGEAFNGIVHSNETVAFYVVCRKEKTTLDAIVAAMVARYDAPGEAIAADVAEIINTPRGNPCVGGIKALFRFLPISYNVRQGSEKNPAW